ncbi:hypothetical protein C2E23DRAFT_727970, partial [Lenzites betulinus]
MIRRLIRAARKHGIRCAAKLPAKQIKEYMPVWHHIGAISNRARAGKVVAECLRLRHGVSTVGECDAVAKRTVEWGGDHEDIADCECAQCEEDRTVRGCSAPHACARAAERIIANIEPKWNPGMEGNVDGLTLTRHRRENNARARDEHGRITFDPTVSQEGPLANAMRAFTLKDEENAWATRAPRPFAVTEESVEVYVDGSCVHGRDGAPRAGCGVWFGENDARNVAARVCGGGQTNQIAELEAILIATARVPPFAPLHIVSD